jgi:hypothetical protein
MLKRSSPNGPAATCTFSNVEISSFSAGYAAVRELLKVPAYFEIINRITLLDSLYARFSSGGERGRKATDPAFEHIEPWLPFAQAAIKGQKTFLITYSQVPTPSYASSEQTTEALLRAVGVPVLPVEPNSGPAASEPDCPLLRRSDFGRFHVWGYGGKDQRAHLVHARTSVISGRPSTARTNRPTLRHVADINTSLQRGGTCPPITRPTF